MHEHEVDSEMEAWNYIDRRGTEKNLNSVLISRLELDPSSLQAQLLSQIDTRIQFAFGVLTSVPKGKKSRRRCR